jgi:hypothetical protein
VRFKTEEQVSGTDVQGGGGGFGYRIPIKLADLSPGRHVLRVEARARMSPDGAVVREVPFDVQRAGGPAQ